MWPVESIVFPFSWPGGGGGGVVGEILFVISLSLCLVSKDVELIISAIVSMNSA